MLCGGEEGRSPVAQAQSLPCAPPNPAPSACLRQLEGVFLSLCLSHTPQPRTTGASQAVRSRVAGSTMGRAGRPSSQERCPLIGGQGPDGECSAFFGSSRAWLETVTVLF